MDYKADCLQLIFAILLSYCYTSECLTKETVLQKFSSTVIMESIHSIRYSVPWAFVREHAVVHSANMINVVHYFVFMNELL